LMKGRDKLWLVTDAHAQESRNRDGKRARPRRR
jgi:hypothetical protein